MNQGGILVTGVSTLTRMRTQVCTAMMPRKRWLCGGSTRPVRGSINDGSGFPAFRVPYSDLPPVPTGQNILIAELGAVRFYRNLQGEYVVIAGPDAEGKEYVVLWDACPPSYVQRFIKQADTLQRTQ